MDKAAEEATKSGHEWALDHLPPVLLCGGFQRPNRRIVRDLFRVLCSANKEYAYERGQMRFVVQKPLYPFKILTNVKDICQVILIIAFGTSHPYFPIASRSHLFSPSVASRPSWDPPRDLSLSDITYRVIEDKLTD